jgi:tetratricopeptide (TPR) repeat protein
MHSFQSSDTRSNAPQASPRPWAAATILAVAIGVVYARGLDAPFLFDDVTGVVHNPSIVSLWPLIGTDGHAGPLNPPKDLPVSGRPLVNLSFALNRYLGGTHPFGYHAVNVLLHIGSAILLWALVRTTLRLPHFAGRFAETAGWLALAIALLWSLHPLATEAVIYTSQRTELMMALFYLATIYCSVGFWLSGKDVAKPRAARRAGWLVLAVLACAAGMASKEVMVSAPVVVLLFDRAFISGSIGSALRRSWPLYVGLAATWTLLIALNVNGPRSSSAGFHLDVAPHAWWFTQCKVLLMYLKLAIWPSPLLFHYQLPYVSTFAEAAVYVIPVGLIAVVSVVLLWRNSAFGFLLAFMAAILSPTFVVPIVSETAAERRMYLPLAGLVAMVVIGAYLLLERRVIKRARHLPQSPTSAAPLTAIILSTAVLALVDGIASAKRLGEYYDETLLWEQVARRQPHNYMAHYDLGLLYNYAGREAESVAELEAAIAANPNYANARSAFGFAMMNAGRLDVALDSLKRALALDPEHVGALNNMGILLTRQGRYPEAIQYLQRAIQIHPEHSQAHLNLGKALAASGKVAEAVPEFEAASALVPDDAEILNNLATALVHTGRSKEAIGPYNKLLKLNPDLLGAYVQLCDALAEAGRYGEAKDVARRGIAAAESVGDEAVAARLARWLKSP